MNIAGIVPLAQTAEYLRTLPAIRERCSRVHHLATQGKLQYFDYHPEKEDAAIDLCIGIMKDKYKSADGGVDVQKIPPHGRWRHLDAGSPRVVNLLSQWSQEPNAIDQTERARRTIDLFLVSVLLDAGAGNVWKYDEKETSQSFARSEGLGVASFRMFESGFFSSVEGQPFQVDAQGLLKVTPQRVADAMQVSEQNPMVGVDGRANLLSSLGTALKANPEFFGKDGRPGNIVDFLAGRTKTDSGVVQLPLPALWHVMIQGLSPIWPSRLTLASIPMGDVWPCPALRAANEGPHQEADDLVPFHKLTQWLTYSLVEVIETVLRWKVVGMEDMTGLPEYRNGGLLVDLGVLTLKPNALPTDPKSGLPYAEASHPAIVEWRALTVIELDRLAAGIRKKLDLTVDQLSLAQILESATWNGGRHIAKQKRPETGGPPIEIQSDGTVF
ncbi:DUF1688-domain-containing protein [Coprinopsis marcescibilis]|uniref:DUF1688-domain-containing protein n=1 Tax=Coprinopsis marcescibilis TaxID=230819 RepID=A0A5C3KL94_COPMA|nr:DUF1688-domain-containing protein [Coprinopsis marcescibilis]